jgi:hypothetical protein
MAEPVAQYSDHLAEPGDRLVGLRGDGHRPERIAAGQRQESDELLAALHGGPVGLLHHLHGDQGTCTYQESK